MSGAMNTLQEAIGWLHVLVAFGGAVVCALNLKRSRWVLVVLAGFGAEAGISLCYRVLSFVVSHGTTSYSSISWLFLFLAFFDLVASIAVVGGLAGVFADRGAVTRVVRDPGPE